MIERIIAALEIGSNGNAAREISNEHPEALTDAYQAAALGSISRGGYASTPRQLLLWSSSSLAFGRIKVVVVAATFPNLALLVCR
jgi:hypothetical protein